MIRLLFTLSFFTAISLAQIFSPLYFGLQGSTLSTLPTDSNSEFLSDSFELKIKGTDSGENTKLILLNEVSETEIEESGESFDDFFKNLNLDSQTSILSLTALNEHVKFLRYSKNYHFPRPVRLHLANRILLI